ncbi:uncharacterized protein [Palaemon carinicauda]|uniref:uncharacterized protein n=1 Tax=Palaemon carinicauda TaxID=392227 RepID=UPI0035B6AA0C
MRVVQEACRHFEEDLKGNSVALMSDNATVVAYIKEGGLRSKELCELALQILKWAEKEEINLTARFIPGKKNVLADGLSMSGQVVATKWSLHPQVASYIIQMWGSPVMDLFATRLNAQLPVFSCPRPEGSNGRHLSTQMGRPRRVRFSPLLPNKTSPQQGEGGNQPKDDFGSALVAGERVVRRPKESRHSSALASSRQTRPIETTTFSEVSRKPTSPSSSRLEVIQHLLKRQGYSSKTARRMSLYLRKSSTAVYQSKWTLFVKWCKDKKIEPLEASVPIIADFMVHLRDKLAISVPAIKGVRAALGQVFLLKGIDLGSSRHISMLIKAFEQSCPPSAPRIPSWDLARVLDMLRKPPFEPLKDIVDKNLTFKAVFLLALASAKRVGELHGLSYDVEHSRGWKEITFKFVPSFVAKTQNPSVWEPRFESFTIPAIPNEGIQEDLKLCPVRVIRKYLKRTANLHPSIKNLFVSWGKSKKNISKNTVSFWLRQVIMQAYSKEGLSAPGKPKAHDVRGMSTSLAFEKNMSVAQVLRAGTWSNQSTFTDHYLKECTRKSLDGFSIGPVISALHPV